MTLSLCQQTLTIQRIYFILCDRDQFEFNIIWKSFKTTNFNSIGAQLHILYKHTQHNFFVVVAVIWPRMNCSLKLSNRSMCNVHSCSV